MDHLLARTSLLRPIGSRQFRSSWAKPFIHQHARVLSIQICLLALSTTGPQSLPVQMADGCDPQGTAYMGNRAPVHRTFRNCSI